MTAFIWDLDGTLIDSYEAIMEALEATYRAFDFQDWDKEAIHAYILKESVGQLLEKKAGEKPFSTTSRPSVTIKSNSCRLAKKR